jgi:hypothetical protein
MMLLTHGVRHHCGLPQPQSLQTQPLTGRPLSQQPHGTEGSGEAASSVHNQIIHQLT